MDLFPNDVWPPGVIVHAKEVDVILEKWLKFSGKQSYVGASLSEIDELALIGFYRTFTIDFYFSLLDSLGNEDGELYLQKFDTFVKRAWRRYYAKHHLGELLVRKHLTKVELNRLVKLTIHSFTLMISPWLEEPKFIRAMKLGNAREVLGDRAVTCFTIDVVSGLSQLMNSVHYPGCQLQKLTVHHTIRLTTLLFSMENAMQEIERGTMDGHLFNSKIKRWLN